MIAVTITAISSLILLLLCSWVVWWLEQKTKSRIYWPRWACILLSPLAVVILYREWRQLEHPPTPANVRIDYTRFRRRNTPPGDDES
jgi:hypothetical protein